MSSGDEFVIRRVLLAAHPSAHGRAALEVAASLASALGVELAGMYVREDRLLRLRGVPFLQEVDALSGRVRALDAGDLERQIRAEAGRIREAVGRTAESLGLDWSFRVVQGEVAAMVGETAAELDLVTVGFRARAVGTKPGSTVRELIARSRSPVMVIRRGMRLGPEVHVVDDGTDSAARALGVARALSKGRSGSLTIHVVDDGEEERISARREEQLERPGHGGAVVAMSSGRGVTGPLADPSCGLLVLPKSMALKDEETLNHILGRASCPVLVV